MKYYSVYVTCTSKAYTGRGDWQAFDNLVKKFNTISEVKEWLKEQYGDCKRVKMYVDKKDGTTAPIGYIYCFRNADWSHSPVQKWTQQDWVEIRETRERPCLV